MPDTREQILARLVAVAEAMPASPPVHVYRNKVDIPEKSRPAIIVLDGDEFTDESSFGRKRPAVAPLIMVMTPEIYVALSGRPDTVGTDLNAFARRFMKAVLTDSSLVELSHEGDIRYEGMSTGLAAGRSIEGEAVLTFSFRYILRPNDIAA